MAATNSSQEPVVRPASRILCLDPYQRLLLLRWRDPVSGVTFWEPPGGGLQPGEDHLAAARRELHDRTGLPPELVTAQSVPVHRDFRWRGRWYAGTEHFFLGRMPAPHEVRPVILTAEEDGALLEGLWLSWDEVLGLPEPTRPPHLADVLTALDPSGPWNPEPPWSNSLNQSSRNDRATAAGRRPDMEP
ncbi:NUDIX domain-containing protein [Streptomyces sp. NPDC020800]|uniref:NUDIX domain-containing protein n=1 Tax=Streptomyces sp. NPDC020800 TaxID=3365092 RepID=UPI0037AC85AD